MNGRPPNRAKAAQRRHSPGKGPGPLNAQASAALIVHRVDQGESLSTALPERLARSNDADRGRIQEIAYGVLREAPRLDFLADRLLSQPLRERDRDIHALLQVGLYQLWRLAIPTHAAVNETVNAARQLGKDWAAGLLNAVLRGFLRQREALETALADAPEAVRLGLPGWLLNRLRADWPEQMSALTTASLARPPMTLRINLARTTRDEWLRRAHEAGIPALPHPVVNSAVTLETPCDVRRLLGFTEGEVSVQDAAAQLCASLLDAGDRQRVLDACAAPGGKTLALLERAPQLDMLALDIDATRLGRVHENLERAGLSAVVRAADAARPDEWWDGRPFERILLDAPCSATGVIRRHPDIARLRRPEDIDPLTARQAELLDALWPLLAPGGRLLYATCSILRVENELQIDAFLRRHPDAHEIRLPEGWGQARPQGRQILTGEDGMDGFYYALLEKPA